MATAKRKKEWVSAAECADRLNVHRSTVTRWIRRGLLPAWKLGNVVRIDWHAVESIMDSSDGRSEIHTDKRTTAP